MQQLVVRMRFDETLEEGTLRSVGGGSQSPLGDEGIKDGDEAELEERIVTNVKAQKDVLLYPVFQRLVVSGKPDDKWVVVGFAEEMSVHEFREKEGEKTVEGMRKRAAHRLAKEDAAAAGTQIGDVGH